MMFIDYLPFETSEGCMTGAALKTAGDAVWVDKVPKFKQLKPIFMAQGKLLICTGYTYDTELITKLSHIFSLPMEPLYEESMDLVLEEPEERDEQRAAVMIRIANDVLREFDCQAEIRCFLPADLPVLYAMNDEVQFLRQIQSAKETGGIFSDALTSLLKSVEERPLATLYLNLNNPLIRRLTMIQNDNLLKSVVRVLYVQALLAGGHPLQGGEMKTMNEDILNLINSSVR